MRRWIGLALTLGLALALSGCGSGDKEADKKPIPAKKEGASKQDSSRLDSIRGAMGK